MGDGVTVETNVHGRYLGDERFEPVWQELDRRAAAVFVHPTSPPAADAVANGRPLPMLEFIFDATRAATGLVFTGVLTRYPDIQWVFTHDRHRRAHGRGRLPQGAGEGQPGRSRHTRRHRRGHPGLDTGQRGPLLFAAAHRFLLELTETSDVKVVILRMSRISVIDSSGARVLEDAIDRLTKRGVLVLVSGVRPEHHRPLAALGTLDALRSAGHVFATTPEAVEFAHGQLSGAGVIAAPPAGRLDATPR